MKMRTAQKIVLTFILSSACILVYQYQISRAKLFSQDGVGGGADEVVHLKLLSNAVALRRQQQPLPPQQPPLLPGVPPTMHTTTSISSTYPRRNLQKLLKLNKTSSSFSSYFTATNYSPTLANDNNTNNKFPTHSANEKTNNNNMNSADIFPEELSLKSRSQCSCDENISPTTAQGHVIIFFFIFSFIFFSLALRPFKFVFFALTTNIIFLFPSTRYLTLFFSFFFNSPFQPLSVFVFSFTRASSRLLTHVEHTSFHAFLHPLAHRRRMGP